MRRPRSAIEVGLYLFGSGVGEVLLLISVLLRELPEFWLNRGGYPLLLRQLVRYVHYPLLFLVFGGLTVCSVMALRHFADNRVSGRRLLIAGALQWLLFFAILVIMLWNNVQNLLNGRPLHYHPDA
jgi:hypothetical protein